MTLVQCIGYSGSGLSRKAKQIAADPDVAYISAVAEQHLSYMRETVIEEIAVGLEHRGVPAPEMDRRCRAIAEQLGISELLERNPLELSGGQTRKLTIASVLVLEPAHLVLDDPFAGLDEASAEELKLLLRDLSGRTEVTLFSTKQHYADVPVEIIGADPRREPQLPEPVAGQTGLALAARISGSRGQDKRWWRPGRVDFEIGPIQVEVPAGGALWIQGSNGSGKTTLLRALAERPDCAFMHQDPYDALIDTTVAAMVPQPWLGRLDLDGEVHPFDLCTSDMKLAQLGSVLGAGRAIALLDEPDVGLDVRGTELFYATLALHLSLPNTGVVLVTHQREFGDRLKGIAQVKTLNVDTLQ